MFVGTVLLALVIGTLAGGSLPRLAALRLRWLPLLVSALLLRIIAELAHESPVFELVPVGWAYTLAYLLIFAWLWANWRVPGLQLASVGIASNALAVLLSAGRMPVWPAAFTAAGFSPADIANDPFHYLLETDRAADFVARGGIFGDVVPIPLPIVRDVMSIGDVLLALGIGWAIVHSMTRLGAPRRRIRMAPGVGGSPLGVGTAGFSGGVALSEATGAPGGAAVAALPPAAVVQEPVAAGVEGEEVASPYLR